MMCRIFSVLAIASILFSGVFASPLSPGCQCGIQCVFQAAKQFGCSDGNVKCACDNWSAIEPIAIELGKKPCPEDVACARSWSTGMCQKYGA